MCTKYTLALLTLLLLAAFLVLAINMDNVKMLSAWPSFFRHNTLIFLLAASLAYTLMLAIPYMPSMTLGLLMMATFGNEGILAAWLCTMMGLNLSFAGGRYLTINHCLKTVDSKKRLARWIHYVQRRVEERPGWARHIAIATLLNLPGNSLLGGGGGIAMFCGTLRSISWPCFVVTVAIATAVLPLLIYFGLLSLDSFINRDLV
ncbi:MAG: hypothetical protein GXP17_03825 [Gammaproteobacteria bacterium]|nr:hypothetical protein [Gammaproteobacteria bacterium]